MGGMARRRCDWPIAWGFQMAWVLRLVETGTDGPARVVDATNIGPLGVLGDIANLGLTLSEAKQILARLQQAVVSVQADDHAVLRPDCSACGAACHVEVARLRRVATLFGTVPVRLPRFRCAGWGQGETGIGWLSYSGPHQSSTSYGRMSLLRCHIASPLARWHTFCRSNPGRPRRRCEAARLRLARAFATSPSLRLGPAWRRSQSP
jgi:hypothetical protein